MSLPACATIRRCDRRIAKRSDAHRPETTKPSPSNAAKAIAAYLETLTSPRIAFDDFRDALVRGDKEAMARYPLLAQRGLAIFVGTGHCTTCHSGPRLSNGEFHDVGIPYFAEPGRVDPGRFGGIKKLRDSRYNLLGTYNDDAKRRTAVSTRHVALDHRNYGEFKVPSLRGVSAPRRTCTTAASRRCATWCVITPISTSSGSTPTASAS